MASRPHLENQELIITHTFLNSQVNSFQPDYPGNDPMLMQDNSSAKQVAWVDADGKKLVNDDSSNDLLYQENPPPVLTHKQ